MHLLVQKWGCLVMSSTALSFDKRLGRPQSSRRPARLASVAHQYERLHQRLAQARVQHGNVCVQQLHNFSCKACGLLRVAAHHLCHVKTGEGARSAAAFLDHRMKRNRAPT